MTLQELNYLSEIIAGAAVVISLIYLSMQLKQNTQAVRLGTVQNVTEEVRDWNKIIAQNEDLAAIMLKGFQAPHELEGIEKFRNYCMLFSIFWAYENAYVQQKAGALEADEWGALRQSIIDFSKVPGMQAYWNDRKHWFGQNFQEYMAAEILSTPAAEGYRAAGT